MAVASNNFSCTASQHPIPRSFEETKKAIDKIITQEKSSFFCEQCVTKVFTLALSILAQNKSPASFTYLSDTPISLSDGIGVSRVVAIKNYVLGLGDSFYIEMAVKVNETIRQILTASGRVGIEDLTDADLRDKRMDAVAHLNKFKADLFVKILGYIPKMSFENIVFLSVTEAADRPNNLTYHLEKDIEKYIEEGNINFPLLAEHLAFFRKDKVIELIPKFSNHVFYGFEKEENRKRLMEVDAERAKKSERMILPALLASFHQNGYETSGFEKEREFLKEMVKMPAISRESLIDILSVFCRDFGFLEALYAKLLPKMQIYLEQVSQSEIESFLDSVSKVRLCFLLTIATKARLKDVLTRLSVSQKTTADQLVKIRALLESLSLEGPSVVTEV